MKRPPPWLFVLAGVPYGVVGQFCALVMPFATERAGAPLDAIGWYGTLLYIPSILLFLYAPLVDVGPRRKHWLVITAACGAACLAAAFAMPLPEHIAAYLGFGFAAQLISGLVGSCTGGLMAALLPDNQRGRASGWFNAGNLSGGGLFSALSIWLIGRGVEPRIIGGIDAVAILLPAVFLLRLDEPARTNAGAPFRQTLRDVGEVLWSRAGLTGIALTLSPVGTSALSNYFSGMSDAYGVAPGTVAVVTGLGSVGSSALGAFIGGYLCDRFNRRAVYLVAGTLTAACGIAMALSPRVAATYIAGVLVYALITGFCYAAFTAMVLETIGSSDRTAATKYSLFTAAGNAAITYVGLIDTRFAARGVESVVVSDATLNLVGVAILGVVFWRFRSFGKWRHAASPPTGDPA